MVETKDSPTGPLFEHFSSITDPRMNRTRHHHLDDILVIAICAVLCGAEDWVSIERFGKAKEDWFKRFLRLPAGIPSHDTFGACSGRSTSMSSLAASPTG